jgi:hypothetical protein
LIRRILSLVVVSLFLSAAQGLAQQAQQNDTPAQAQKTTPPQTQEAAPAQAPEAAPAENPQAAPAQTQKAAPPQTQEAAPAQAPEAAPAENPQAAPAQTQEAAPPQAQQPAQPQPQEPAQPQAEPAPPAQAPPEAAPAPAPQAPEAAPAPAPAPQAAPAPAPEPAPEQAPEAVTAAPAIPAATESDIECAGFITANSVPTDVYVFDGADNDYRSPFRQFVQGEYVYLRGAKKGGGGVGSQYRIVRPSTGSLLGGGGQLPMFGRATWYPGQDWAISALGQAYEDVGRVKVTAVTPHGAVAQVTFSCGPIVPYDIAVPFKAREIPTYDPTVAIERFAVVAKSKKTGAITAARGNDGVLGNGGIAYISRGEKDGVQAGERYRIFHRDREVMRGGWRLSETPPAETVGEMVILFTQERSSVGIVVRCFRDITLGDGVSLE